MNALIRARDTVLGTHTFAPPEYLSGGGPR